MSRQTTFGASPMSSMGSRNSTANTPITQMSTFSPHYGRSTARAPQRTTLPPLREGHDDPFVIDGPKSKGEGKLSATAKPFTLPSSHVVPKPSANEMAREYLEKEIRAAHTNTCHGVFTTDTETCRCMKVSPIYNNLNALGIVTASLQNMRLQGHPALGGLRIEQDGNAVLLKFNNIIEAIATHDYLKTFVSQLCNTDYIPVRSWAEVTDPLRADSYSEYEGQVHLRVRVHADVPRERFEDDLRHLLSEDLGPYTAWQIISPPDAPNISMIAEYFDSSIAPRAVKKLHSMFMGEDSTEEVIVISMVEHKPDLKPRTLSLGTFSAQATPSRRQVDQPQPRLSGAQVDIRDPSVISSFNAEPVGDLARQVDQLSVGGFPQTSASFGGPTSYLGSAGTPPFQMVTAQLTFPPRPAPLLMAPGGLQYHPPTPGQAMYSQSHLNATNNMNVPRMQLGPYDHFGQHTPESMHHTASPKNRTLQHRQSYINNRGSNSNHRNHRTNFQKGNHHGHNKRNDKDSEHNVVCVEAIQMGIDVRTTVMLRNIPNRLTLGMLISIINRFAFGTYDFLYLRIDFRNNCNVGYAFINFTDPLHIVTFHKAISGQTWGRFHSHKVAMISYATIQGRDCLIQKFRNSSVMLEHESYRPKLYYTWEDGNKVGTEEEFPPVDNPAKLQRSCQNAEQQGLFAPNAGQQVRASQRGRRSQYDRGTTMAELDEFEFDRYDHHESRRLEALDDSYDDM